MDTTTTGPVVVVGAGLAGLRVAERLRRLGYDDDLTLVGGEDRPPYDRPPLSKTLLTQEDEPAAPVPLRRDPYDDLGLDLRLGVNAEWLDPVVRRLGLADGAELGYGRLVIATGVRARELSAFAGYVNVLTLRTWDDCLALRSALRRVRRLTVVGGGVLGCEIAASARTLGLEVDLVEGLAQPLARVLGIRIGEVLARLHAQHGVRLHLGTVVDRVAGNEHVESLVLADGTRVDTDLVVVAVGAAPNTEWLAGSGLDVTDGVLVDRTGATAAEAVFAAGDIARMPRPDDAGSVRLEHWTSANDTAALVAGNLLAKERKELAEVPYFWSDQYDAKLQCLGVPDPEDDVTVADGSPEQGPFLALYSREGRVTGAVGIGKPAALARCRAAVGAGRPLADLLDEAPWVRRAPVAPATTATTATSGGTA